MKESGNMNVITLNEYIQENDYSDSEEFLLEARQGLILYYYCKLSELINILENNKLSIEDNNLYGFEDYYEGLVLSRNYSSLLEYIKDVKGYLSPLCAVLVLDGEKLSWNYRITPINSYNKRQASVEMIQRDIEPLNRYIVRVDIADTLMNDSGRYGFCNRTSDFEITELIELSAREYFKKYANNYESMYSNDIYNYFDLCNYLQNKNIKIGSHHADTSNKKENL